MKCISLWQPWASYVAYGMKRFETRHWRTNHRGPLAIHAARRPIDIGGRALLGKYPLRRNPIRFGFVIATCRLVDVIAAPRATNDERENELGDFGPERYAWILLDVVPLQVPIATRGRQGLFDVDLGV